MDSEYAIKIPRYFSSKEGGGCIEREPVEHKIYCSNCHLNGSTHCPIFGHPENQEVLVAGGVSF